MQQQHLIILVATNSYTLAVHVDVVQTVTIYLNTLHVIIAAYATAACMYMYML